jgi:hypothetical protein
VEVGVKPGRRGPRNDGSNVRTQPNWKFMKFFSAPVNTVSGNPYYKNIFQPPAAAYVDGTLYLAFGTGERSAIGFTGVTDCTPLGGTCTTSSPSRQENNRYYVVTDPDPLQGAATIPAAVTEADLTNVSVVGTSVTSTRGYYFRTLDGEKFVTTSAIFAGKVIAASFTPSLLKAGDPGFDPCTQRGSGKLYKFNLKTGVGDFTDAVEQRVALHEHRHRSADRSEDLDRRRRRRQQDRDPEERHRDRGSRHRLGELRARESSTGASCADRRRGGVMRWSAIGVAVGALCVGCGESAPPPSAAAAPAAGDFAAAAANRAPILESVRIDPSEPAQGAIVHAVVTARDPDGQGVVLTHRWFVDGAEQARATRRSRSTRRRRARRSASR